MSDTKETVGENIAQREGGGGDTHTHIHTHILHVVLGDAGVERGVGPNGCSAALGEPLGETRVHGEHAGQGTPLCGHVGDCLWQQQQQQQ